MEPEVKKPFLIGNEVMTYEGSTNQQLKMI